MEEKASAESRRFQRWWEGLTIRQQQTARRLLKVSSAMLSYLRTGRRKISAANAVRIANASARMAATDGRVAALTCGDLAVECRACPHYRFHMASQTPTDIED